MAAIAVAVSSEACMSFKADATGLKVCVDVPSPGRKDF